MAIAKDEVEVDLYAPFERDTILEVRTSRMKTMPGLTIQSGIDKQLRSGKVRVSLLGLEADEHDLTFHGGRDKAVHGYCSSHYAQWAREFPEASARFTPGAFGENLVTAHMNERNVCIGDIVSIGPATNGKDGNNGNENEEKENVLLLQVSLPRQPCFKLNHRFRLKNFAPNTFRTSRTGWYYRVLREGTVQAGDEIRLVERKHPAWTIERVQEYLHRTLDNAEMNEELSQILEMGDESRKAFESRVARYKAKQKRTEGKGGEAEEEEEDAKKDKWRKYRIVEKKDQTPRIKSFVLEAVPSDTDIDTKDQKTNQAEDGDEDGYKAIEHGSYARLRLPNGLVRSYSIVSGSTARRFELGIALEEPSRGGSASLHHNTALGDVLEVGRINSDIKPASAASKHIFIVGGIGITAFLTLAERYRSINYEAVIHYAVRDGATDVPFRERLEALGLRSGSGSDSCLDSGEGSESGGGRGGGVILYDGSKGQRMDIPNIFRSRGWNAHIYVCGPRRMLDSAMHEAKLCGLDVDNEVHFEAFSADTTGEAFEAVVANRGGKVVKVQEEETLLQALRRHFDDTDAPGSSCEVGNCGTCRVALVKQQQQLGSSGGNRVEHRGTALLEEEKQEAMLSCVSRGIGRITIEI